jgi:hypothetical protein
MRRFPPPWNVEAIDAGFKIVDTNKQPSLIESQRLETHYSPRQSYYDHRRGDVAPQMESLGVYLFAGAFCLICVGFRSALLCLCPVFNPRRDWVFLVFDSEKVIDLVRRRLDCNPHKSL